MRTKRLYGKRYGHLTAIAATGEKRYDSSVWLCICDCGKPVEVPLCYLTSGSAKSCGKCQYRGKEITGFLFGRLTALEPTAEKSGRSYYSGNSKPAEFLRIYNCRSNISGTVSATAATRRTCPYPR